VLLKRILVTGASGFVGQHLLKFFEDANYEIVSLERRIWHPASKNVQVIDWPIGNEIPATLAQQEFHALIHLAWDTASRSAWDTQLEQLRRLNQLCELLPRVKKVISLGTSEEYGLANGILDESTRPVLPLSAYGWGKESARQLLASRAKKTCTSLIWLRAFTIYGEGQSGNMLIPYALNQARKGSTAKFTDGIQERDFIYVGDVVRAIIYALNEDLPGNTTLNIGTGIGTQVRNVITAIATHFENNDNFEIGGLARDPNLPLQQLAQTSLADKLIGFTAKTSITEGLARILHPSNNFKITKTTD